MPRNAKSYGVATWKTVVTWAVGKTRTADINQPISKPNYATPTENALNALANVVGVPVKHREHGIRNTAHTRAAAITQHTVRIRKAVASHGAWKNRNARTAKPPFYRVANGFAPHPVETQSERAHPAYAEPVRHYVAHYDKNPRSAWGAILFCKIFVFMIFL